jgi:hypothetical protein
MKKIVSIYKDLKMLVEVLRKLPKAIFLPNKEVK